MSNPETAISSSGDVPSRRDSGMFSRPCPWAYAARLNSAVAPRLVDAEPWRVNTKFRNPKSEFPNALCRRVATPECISRPCPWAYAARLNSAVAPRLVDVKA